MEEGYQIKSSLTLFTTLFTKCQIKSSLTLFLRRAGKQRMPSVKNIGKPYAGEPHVRFDEGGQARACSLLYLFIYFRVRHLLGN